MWRLRGCDPASSHWSDEAQHVTLVTLKNPEYQYSEGYLKQPRRLQFIFEWLYMQVITNILRLENLWKLEGLATGFTEEVTYQRSLVGLMTRP